MKLRNKISIILLALWCMMLVITYIDSQLIIKKSYLDLEEKQATDNIQRINEAMQQIISSVNLMVADWAIWDDTYQFIIDKNDKYKKANLVLSSFSSADIDMILFFNTSGQLEYSMAVNKERTKFVPIPKEFLNYLTPGSLLVNQPTLNSYVQGLVLIPSGILITGARSIVTSNKQGPVRGSLVMAKYFSNAEIEKIKSLTKINLFIYPLSNMNKIPELQTKYDNLQKNNGTVIDRISNKKIITYSFFKDINNKPIAVVKTVMPRNVYQIGLKTINYYYVACIIYSIILMVLLWLLLQKLLVKRLERLKVSVGNDDKSSYFNNLIEGLSDEVSYVASLYHQATHDPLTGLANRNLLDQIFSNHLSKVTGDKSKIAILFIDLDYFKRVNDTLGHDVGDLLLIEVAKQLNGCLRANDLAVRIGGDEFVVMLVNVEIEQIHAVVERIQNALSKKITIQNHTLYLASSMGISTYPNDGRDITTLLKNADIALYHAKENGRNHYQFYSSELNQAIQEAYKKEAELQRAIDNKELCLLYQPIYDAHSKKIISLEALIRWKHPTRGMLGAGEIIPLAEKTGLIMPIGKWVLRTACAQAKKWHSMGLSVVPIAVNISVLQTKQTSIDKLVSKVLSQTGLDAHLLELELTETSYIEITESILNDMHLLRSKGVKLVVDDFGVGYSGLRYLRHLPVSKLKIDQSFIKDIISNPDDRSITLAIIAIAHQLDLKVIAEGVETAAQFEFLKENNVDAVQGFYLSPPVDAATCEAMLSKVKLEETV